MGDENTTTDAATDTTASDAGKQTGTSEPTEYKGKTVQGWHEAYTGLQASYNKLKERSDNVGEELTTTKTNLETAQNQLSEFQTTNNTLTETINQINAKLGIAVEEGSSVKPEDILTKTGEILTQATEGQKAQQELMRKNLLIEEFPGLAQWEKDGLLPKADNEEALRDLFSKFQKNLGTQVDQTVTSKIEGASPEDLEADTDKDDSGNLDEPALIEKLTQLASQTPFNQTEYTKVQAQLDTVRRQKAAKSK